MFPINLKIWLRVLICLSFIVACSRDEGLRWHQKPGYRWAKISLGFFNNVGFDQTNPSKTNIHFQNHLSKQEISDNRVLENGSGVATGDIDGDGRVDLYFAQLDGPNKLYKNLGGFHFKDITDKAGVSHMGYHSTGAVFADVDGDGDLDLLVTSLIEKNVLYINDGAGNFKIKSDSGLDKGKGSTTMALADIDGDSDLDLYITNYKEKTVRDIYEPKILRLNNTIKVINNTFKIIPPFDKYYKMVYTKDRPYRKEYGERDELYINNGNGGFNKVYNLSSRFLNQNGKKLGLSRDWGLSAKFQDLNDDGRPDLYVCNDFWSPDRVWINQGNGVFKAINSTSIRNSSFASMSVDFSDINRDGSKDIFVTEMLSKVHEKRMRQYSQYIGKLKGEVDSKPQYNNNSLYLNRGDKTYAQIAYFSGIEASGWSWATNFLDIDLDGYEDLIITTGNTYDVTDLDAQTQINNKIATDKNITDRLLEYPSLKLSNQLFRNNHDLTFSNKSSVWGFNRKDVSQGMALADLDNDGDLDIITNRLNETAGIYENKVTAPRVAVRLIGEKPNTQAIGANIKLIGGPVDQEKEVVSGGGYLSGSDPLAVFAADKKNKKYKLIITWPNGKKSTINSVQANRIYKINESSISAVGTNKDKKGKETDEPYFEDISSRINHNHHENTFDDFSVQPLLPFKLSQRGPGVAWIDVDQDNDDDLLIGTGKGGRLSVYENLGGAHFKSIKLDDLTSLAPGDQTTILGWNEKNKTRILVGNSSYEQENIHVPSAFQYIINQNQNIEKDSLQGVFSATGPLAAADYDGNGDIDLFIGGNFKPGIYPADANSMLFRNRNGDFQLDKANSRKLREIGLVTGAVFTDYDQDGDQDLLISREWDSIVLLENENGTFKNISDKVGLSNYKGWWNGVATGDFNNDGMPDIIATNLGLNSVYQNGSKLPLKMYYDDFNNDGQLDIIDTFYNKANQSYVPRRRLYQFKSLSNILGHIKSYQQFANSSVGEIFRRDFKKIPSKKINTLQSMLFINTRKGFEAHPLPEEAQFSVAFDASVADFNNDGNEDIFLSQNFFGFPPNIPRLDAGRGLWLKGDGKGNFKTIVGNRTGIKVYGEQRGAALSDFNSDGKVDIAISQNGAATKLYLNKINKSGLRIHLVGPNSNKNAIDSSIRLIYKDGSKGPRREIQAGSGYWSQNSTTQVMGTSRIPEKIEVKWFNGKVKTIDIQRGKKNYRIKY